MDTPCKDCENRHIGCHGHCEFYREYRESLDAFNEEAKRKKAGSQNYMGYIPRTKPKPIKYWKER